jgi:HAD superfamily phosphoserine phosphatase-like hydrolase
MNKVKAVIFDIDGTLSPENSWTAFSRDLGSSVADHLAIFHDHLKGHIGLDQSKKMLLELWLKTGNAKKQYIETMYAGWPLRDDAKEVVDWLQSKDIRVCLITGSVDLYAEHIARRLGVEDYYANATLLFDQDGSLESFNYTTDQAEVKLQQFREFCKKYGLKESECIAVGDGDNDIELFRHTSNGVLLTGSGISNELQKATWQSIDRLGQLKNLIQQ